MSFPPYQSSKYSDSAWIGNIPSHWDILPIKVVVSCNDEVLPEGTPSDYQIEYVEISDVTLESGLQGSTSLKFEDAPSRARRIVRSGDILVSTVRTYLKAIAPIGVALPNLIASTGFAVLRPKASVLSKYVGYVVQSEQFVADVISRSVGVSYPAINSSDLVRIKCSLPPLDEQNAVSIFLDHETSKIDALISEQERLIELLIEKRDAAISHAVARGIDPLANLKDSGTHWLGKIPSQWQCGAFRNVASRVVVGIAEAATHAYSEIGIPILRSTNIRPGRITGEVLHVTSEFALERESKRMIAGDLVTVRTGNAGVTAIVPAEMNGAHCFTMLITTLLPEQCSQYFCYFLNSASARAYFSLEGWGTAQVNISVPILKSIPVPIPSLNEQQAIVAHLKAVVEDFDRLMAEAKKSIVLLHERRIALIGAAVTGKIDVRGLV